MSEHEKWCHDQGGLRNFSARRAFPNLVKYFNFAEKVWMTYCRTASSLTALEAAGKDTKEAEDLILWKSTVFHLTWKTLKTQLALLRLLEHGFVEDAFILLRSMLESAITLEYISRDVPARIRLYREYSFVFKHRIREANKDIFGQDHDRQEDQEKLDLLNLFEINYQRVKNNYPQKSSWSQQTIYQMAQEVGLEFEYRTMYAYFCQYSHNTVITENGFLKEDGRSLQLMIEPDLEDEKGFNTALHFAISYTLKVMSIFDSVFQTGHEPDLLFEEYKEIYGINRTKSPAP